MRRALAYLREHWLRVLGVSALLFVFFGNQGFISLVRNGLELRRLRRELSELDRSEAEQREKLRLLRSGDFSIERLARKELGFIKKGEIEYRFPPPEKQEDKE